MKLSIGQQEGRDREPENLGIDGRIMLNWILDEWHLRVCIELVWPKIRSSVAVVFTVKNIGVP